MRSFQLRPIPLNDHQDHRPFRNYTTAIAFKDACCPSVLLSAGSLLYPLSAICAFCLLVACLLSARCLLAVCLLSAVCCLLFAVCCLLSAVCCLLSAVAVYRLNCCLVDRFCGVDCVSVYNGMLCVVASHRFCFFVLATPPVQVWSP